jgi:hypothetical protein
MLDLSIGVDPIADLLAFTSLLLTLLLKPKEPGSRPLKNGRNTTGSGKSHSQWGFSRS